MAQQTAVEWLIQQVKSKEWQDMYIWHKEEIFKQAKAMEKEQIKIAYSDGADHMVESKYEGMDNYYKLRYGSNNKI